MATEQEIEIVRSREQKYRHRRSKDFYFPRDIIFSKAWQKLTDNKAATAMFVYMIFRTKMVMKPHIGAKAKSKGSYFCENIDSIQFTYREALRKYGLWYDRFRRAIDLLIEVGLIDLTYQSSGVYKDVNLYGISERWMNYGKPEFIVKKRTKKKAGYGFKRGKKRKSLLLPTVAIQLPPTVAMKKGKIENVHL